MPLARYERPALRRPTQGVVSPDPESAPTPTSTPNNDLFQEFIRTCIKKVRDQALTVPVIPVAPAAKVRNNIDSLLKS